MRLFAVAPLFRESTAPGSSLFDALLGIVDKLLEARSVLAIKTGTIVSTLLPL